MRVFVAGATGAIGRQLVPQLLEAGHDVTATTRTPAKAKRLRALGAVPVLADGLDAIAMTSAVGGAKPEVVIHQMTALAGRPDLRRFDRWFAKTNQLRTRGTDILLAAAREAGVRRFIAQSYTGWNNPRRGGPVSSESAGLDLEALRQQRRSIAAIRHVESIVPDALSEGIVLRYGNLYGPGASDSLVELVQKRRLPVVGAGTGVWSWIHVEDAASATVAALEHGTAGLYNIVDDDPASVSEWLPYLAQTVSAKPPPRVPLWLARPLVGEVAVRWLTEGRGASNEKARRALGWRPRWSSWREGFREKLTNSDLKGADPAAQAELGTGWTRKLAT